MTKKYFSNQSNNVVLIGDTKEIKAIYNSIYRAWEKGKTDLTPLFEGKPLFSSNKFVYGIEFGEDGFFTIITSDAFAQMLLDGFLYTEELQDYGKISLSEIIE